MFYIDRVSKSIAEKVAYVMDLDKDHEEVLAYGAFSILQTLWSIFLVFIFGYIFHVLKEALIISFIGTILRKYSGGAHATSPNRCAVIGVMICGGLALLVNKVILHADFRMLLIYLFFSFVLAFFIVLKYAPVDTPNKPIKNENKRKKLKRRSIDLILVFGGLMVLFLILYFKFDSKSLLIIGISIGTGMIWQAATLTSLGHLFINKLDRLLNFSD